MDELNIYFEKARELKSEKQLIDDAKLNSIIKKKKITNNLLKGAGAMSILTIITIGLMFLFSEEKPEQKFDPETMRKLPIFHLTVEELEELGFKNIPKSYEEYLKLSDKSEFLKGDTSLLPLNVGFSYKKKRLLLQDMIGSFRISLSNENFSEDIILMRRYLNTHIEKIYKKLKEEQNSFLKNKDFIYEKDKIKDINNLVPISLTDDYGFFTEFLIFLQPTQKLYDKMPERHRERFKNYFKVSEEIVINPIEFQKFIDKINHEKKQRIEKTIKTIDLTASEILNLGIEINDKIISVILGASGEKTNKIQYYKYDYGIDGEVSSKKISSNVNIELVPEILNSITYEKNGDEFKLIKSHQFILSNKFNILQSNTIDELDTENNQLKVSFKKNKKIEDKINKVVPIKFKIDISETVYLEYILWFRISDELISKLPERYKIRFIEEIELMEKVFNEEIKLNDVCKELKNESLLGICVAESVNQVNVYPNPTRDNLNIKIDIENDKQIIIKIFDTAGREIFSTNRKVKNGENDLEINTNNFSRGIYIINIFEHEELLFSRNVIIE